MSSRAALLFLVFMGTTLAHAAELTVEGVDLERSIPCNGQDVGIYGSGHTIELTGACGAIVVHGSSNAVGFEEGASLTVAGIGHTVSGGAVGALVVQGKSNTVSVTVGNGDETATVAISGAEHAVTLELTSAADLVANGLEHRVRWTTLDGAPDPAIQIAGFGSTVEKSD